MNLLHPKTGKVHAAGPERACFLTLCGGRIGFPPTEAPVTCKLCLGRLRAEAKRKASRNA